MTPSSPPTWAVLLAAGKGSRLADAAGGVRKQFLNLDGAPLFWRSARTLAAVPAMTGIAVVFPPEDLDAGRAMIAELNGRGRLGLPLVCAAGGVRRQDSVRLGLAALPAETQRSDARVLVHDAARPFVSAALITRLMAALDTGAAAVIPGVPVVDTIKRVPGGLGTAVAETPERAHLFAVQTPQAFALSGLAAAHQRAEDEGWEVTDDAMLIERAGGEVVVVEGEAANVKITNPEDLRLIEEGHVSSYPVTGFGYDVHRYAGAAPKAKQPARPMVLGTVPIPGAPAVLAHSDGDVLLHALTDAVLGCAGLGDIGTHFPDTDAAFDNASSAVLLSEALRLTTQRGLTLHHADVTLVAQIPKLAPHRDAIRKAVARLLGLAPDRVNVKATTEEGLGFTGRKEGIKAVAVVSGAVTPPAPHATD